MGNGRKTSALARLAAAGLAAGLAAGAQACQKQEAGAGNKQGTQTQAAPAAADSAKARHSCRGKNECKGQGGCAVTEAQLKEMAAKAGIPMEQAGSAHACKGLNECKGLGGCNM